MNDSEIENLKTELEHEKTCRYLHKEAHNTPSDSDTNKTRLQDKCNANTKIRDSILRFHVDAESEEGLNSSREAAAWQNGELEKQIVNMQEELRKSDYAWDHDDDLHRESARHKQLLEAVDTLRAQLPLLKDKIRSAKVCGPDCKLKHDDLNINLDILTPAELLRTVKRFERLKTDLISTLRSKEWRLDSESKLFVRVNDQRTYLQNELMICQNNIMRLQRNGSYWQNIPRKNDERVLDPKRAPIKKIFGTERLPPIIT